MPDTAPLPPAQRRFAGLLYLVIILCGLGAELALRGPLIVPGDAAATAAAVFAGMIRFKAAIGVEIVMVMADIALAVLLWRFFRPVAEGAALMAMVFRLMQAAVIAANLMALVAVANGLAGPANAMTDDTVAMLLALHGQGYDLGLIFFGVNALITGWLLMRAGAPRWLGPALAGAGAVYLTGSFLALFAPAAAGLFQPAYLLPIFAESAFCLWLLLGRAA